MRPALLIAAAGAALASALLSGFEWFGYGIAALLFADVLISATRPKAPTASSEADDPSVSVEQVEAAAALAAAQQAATDAENQRVAAQQSLESLARKLAAGDLAARLGNADGVDPDLASQVNTAVAEINTAVDEALALADIAAAGDLSVRASGAYHGHCAALSEAMNGLLDSLATIVSAISESVADNSARGVEMRTVASAVLDHSQRQASSLASLEAGMLSIEEGLRSAANLSAEGSAASSAAFNAASEGRDQIEAAKASMDDILAAAKEINGVLEMIDMISQQTTLLSVNAGVEAARAGAAGRGFAVVTEEIGHLAARTNTAARSIAEIVAKTNEHVSKGSALVDACDSSIAAIVDAASTAQDCAARIGSACDAELERVQHANTEAATTKASADANLELAARANAVAEALDASVHELDEVVSGFRLEDAAMAEAVRSNAAEISARLENAVANGEITLEELFSENYEPIADTNPQQFSAPFVALTDRLFPPVLESVFNLGDEIAFSAAVNTAGFLPTHNVKFSQRPGGDPVWNSANCRNRRFFDDRVGLGAGRNRSGHILQVYRRDMGGGSFVTMKDISAPITVRGRHWGGLRIGYRPKPQNSDKIKIDTGASAPLPARSATR